MVDRSYVLCIYYSESLPESPILSAIEAIRDAGFSTVEDGTADRIQQYEIENEEREWADGGTQPRLETVTAEIHAVGEGSISFWYDGFEFSITFKLGDGAEEPWTPVQIRGPKEDAFATDEYSMETIEDRSNAVARLFTTVAEVIDPWYGLGDMWPFAPDGIFPQDYPPNSGVDALPWLSVFGAEWFDRFGGVDRVLETPAFDGQLLETGSVFIRKRDMAAANRANHDTGPPFSASDYLFSGTDLEQRREERREKKNTFVDPFLEFEPGERGVDLVTCRTHAPFEMPEIDYSAVPDSVNHSDRCHVLWVYRDEHDCLREVNSETFVRRLVDENGDPIGDRPEGVAREHELLSLVVGDGTSAMGADLLRMKSLDDPNLLATIYDLQSIDADGGLWADDKDEDSG